MEEMELMYMENNSKVCMDKIFIKQLTNNKSNGPFLPFSCVCKKGLNISKE
jgi:hypothetical protein